MRTREDQAKAMAVGIEGNEIPSERLIWLMAKELKEAEHRAEHRVRTEIGRDSERLDWFEENCAGAKSQWNEKQSLVEWKVKDGEWFPNLRTAIDAAREVG